MPFNSHNIAYLDDVPQTSFPIYFVSALPLDAQDVLGSYFGNLKNDYSIVDNSLLQKYDSFGFKFTFELFND